MNLFRLGKAYLVKRQMIKALWAALDYDGNDPLRNKSVSSITYEGPHVALMVLRNEHKLKKHYCCTDSISGLGMTGRNIHIVKSL